MYACAIRVTGSALLAAPSSGVADIARNATWEIDDHGLQPVALRLAELLVALVELLCLALQRLGPARVAAVDGATAIGAQVGGEAVDQRPILPSLTAFVTSRRTMAISSSLTCLPRKSAVKSASFFCSAVFAFASSSIFSISFWRMVMRSSSALRGAARDWNFSVAHFRSTPCSTLLRVHANIQIL